jgi:hypothetical protein
MSRLYSLLFIAAFAFIHGFAHAQEDLDCKTLACKVLKPLPRQLAYELSIVPKPTDHVLEFTPVDVAFELRVKLIGVVGSVPKPTPVDICPAQVRPETPCKRLATAWPGATLRGTIPVMASWASKKSPIKVLVLAPGGEGEPGSIFAPVQEALAFIPVYARYQVSLDGVNLLTTRSTSTDTLWATLKASVTSTPAHISTSTTACQFSEIRWCVLMARIGNAHDSGYYPSPGVEVGPYDLMPEAEDDLRFLFYVDNIGDSPWQKIGEGVANGFSKVGMIALSAFGASQGGSGTTGFAQQLDQFMGQFHSVAFASCDGVVATDIVVVRNKTIAEAAQSTLDALTRRTGKYSAAPPYIYRNTDGDARCDRRGAAYTARFTVTRTSWREWGDTWTY